MFEYASFLPSSLAITPELSAFAALKQRTDALGTYAPEHYVFHRQWPEVDPTRPMSGWRSAWRSLRKAAALPLRYQTVHMAVEQVNPGQQTQSAIADIFIIPKPGASRRRGCEFPAPVCLQDL